MSARNKKNGLTPNRAMIFNEIKHAVRCGSDYIQIPEYMDFGVGDIEYFTGLGYTVDVPTPEMDRDLMVRTNFQLLVGRPRISWGGPDANA